MSTSNFGREFLSEIWKFGSKSCLIWRGDVMSFSAFHSYVNKWRMIIERQKVRSTDPLRIALFCTNSPDILAVVVACQLCGTTLVPLNPSYKNYEINEYISASDANFVLVSDDVDLENFEEIEVHLISEMLNESIGNEEELENEGGATNCGAIVFFSSGTTGPPKLFEYSQKILCSQLSQIRAIRANSQFCSFSEEAVCYGVLPFFHAGGLITILSLLFSGCTVVINERWNEREFLSNCEKFKVEILFLVPPVLNFLANHPDVSNYNLSSLRTIYVGAAASFPDNFAKVSRRFPQLENLIQLYGTTECGVLVCSTRKGISSGETVGFPFPSVEIKINPRNNEILVKSSTATEDGFMETGDLGWLSFKTKELMIVGRSKEMMKVRGWQVNPNEIEDVIRKVDSVVDCAVYQKIPDETLIAKVVGNPDTKFEIMKIVKDKLASFKQLGDVVFVAELPRNSSGKLVRRLLH